MAVRGAQRWTEEQDAVLLAIELTPHTERHEGDGALARIGRRLGRTESACRSRYRRLVRHAGHRGGQWTEDGLWTASDDAVVRDAIAGCSRVPDDTWPAVAAQLGRTIGACKTRGSALRRLDRPSTMS